MNERDVAEVIRERVTDIKRSLSIPYESQSYYDRLEGEQRALEDLAGSLSLRLPEGQRREWLAEVQS